MKKQDAQKELNEIDELCFNSVGLDDTISDQKHHTIRAGNRFKTGDYFSPRVWSGSPYNSKQLNMRPLIHWL